MSTGTKMLLTILEAADRLALSRSAIYELIAAGEIKIVKYGRATRIQPSELDAWVERQKAAQWV